MGYTNSQMCCRLSEKVGREPNDDELAEELSMPSARISHAEMSRGRFARFSYQ